MNEKIKGFTPSIGNHWTLLEVLHHKIYSPRYDGRIAGIRWAFERWMQAEQDQRDAGNPGIIIAFMFCALSGAVVAFGIAWMVWG